MAERDIYLRIEAIEDYSPVEPDKGVIPPIQYRRDGMRGVGHMDGTIPESERDARALRAVVYREYLDADHLVPRTSKVVAADINEPVWNRRVPGAVLWVYVGDSVRIHVQNEDSRPHSFHIHGLEFGIDSDGAWPMGTQAADGRRSDEICPGQSWTYRFRVTEEMIGVWPFHDHSSHESHGSVKLGLFGALIVRERPFKFPIPIPLPEHFDKLLHERFVKKPRPLPCLEDGIEPRPRRFPEKPARNLLTPHEEVLLHDHYEYLREWLYRLHKNLIWPWWKIEKRLHIPLFLHEMVNDQATPIFDSGDLEENGATFAHVFEDAGSFDYFCQYHPLMTGTVEVVAGAPAAVTVNILDVPEMNFYPDTVQVAPGGTVTWQNMSAQHHTVTARDGAAIASHCLNGRSFVGNAPTIVVDAGTKMRWYVCNLDFGHDWHNFHPHSQRWSLAGESLDARSIGPAESFVIDTVAPPAVILPDHIEAIQSSPPTGATKRKVMGDFVFHCHVHHHMQNGMIGVVRSVQEVWLTDAMEQELLDQGHIHLYDPSNPIPSVEVGRCKKLGPGEWEELTVAPEETFMHACLLRGTDKVLYWGYTDADQARLFDPNAAGGPTVAPPTNQPASLPGMNSDLSDLWSAAHAFLPDGRVLAHGGFAGTGFQNVNAFVFDPDPAAETWSQTASTADPRFYATTITLADGKLMTLFGSASKSIEVWDPAAGGGAGAWGASIALPASMNHHQYYPWTYLLPDGKLFIAGPHDPPQRFDWNLVGAIESFPMISGNRSTGGEKGTSVLLPLHPPYDQPIVVSIGGDPAAARKTAEMIDLSAAAPVWTALPELHEERAEQVQSILLPDGKVVVLGGANAVMGGGPVELLDSRNPLAGWELGPVMTYHRGYHSAAILLADGSVLVGGDPNSNVFERYKPGYFDEPRPQISAATPDPIGYGTMLTITCPEAADVDEVLLLSPGAVTHGFNMTQRALYCTIDARGPGTLEVITPPNGNVAPPGWYLLFVVDGLRVPSVGHWVRLG